MPARGAKLEVRKQQQPSRYPQLCVRVVAIVKCFLDVSLCRVPVEKQCPVHDARQQQSLEHRWAWNWTHPLSGVDPKGCHGQVAVRSANNASGFCFAEEPIQTA